jgi:hypothetical protein
MGHGENTPWPNMAYKYLERRPEERVGAAIEELLFPYEVIP